MCVLSVDQSQNIKITKEIKLFLILQHLKFVINLNSFLWESNFVTLQNTFKT